MNQLLAKASFGSRFYGTAHADSDDDVLHVYELPGGAERRRISKEVFLNGVRAGIDTCLVVLWTPPERFQFLHPDFLPVLERRQQYCSPAVHWRQAAFHAQRLLTRATEKSHSQLCRLVAAATFYRREGWYPAEFSKHLPDVAARIRSLRGDSAGLLAYAHTLMAGPGFLPTAPQSRHAEQDAAKPVQAFRRGHCDGCEANQGGVCRDLQALEPHKPAIIQVGIKQRKARCPRGIWGRAVPPPVQPSGIVIGSYYWADVIHLQIMAIRDTCGDVPIYVSDDCSPGHPCGRHNGPQWGWLKEICRRAKVPVSPNARNTGHGTGDLLAVRKGLQWATEHGLRYLVKLSQRLVLTRPGWLQEAVAAFAESGHATGGVRGLTDAILLDVARWQPVMQAEVTGEHHAKNIWMEGFFHGLHDKHFGGENFWTWPLVGNPRSAPADGMLWHDANPEADYHALAKRYGIELRDFQTSGSHLLPSYHGG